jgi:hypothetical protein
MLVVLLEEQILSAQHICCNCVLASQAGQPRWHDGKLGCGRTIQPIGQPQMTQYVCQMGFRLTNIDL